MGAELTVEQRRVLTIADQSGVIITGDDDKVCPGIHFCPDLNGLAICGDSPEDAICTCANAYLYRASALSLRDEARDLRYEAEKMLETAAIKEQEAARLEERARRGIPETEPSQ